jgi:PAS domain S-box-containing protein
MRDWGGLLTILFGLWAVGYILWLSFSSSSSEHKTIVTDVAVLPVTLVMTALAWRASRHKALGGRVRRAWKILAVAFFTYFVGSSIWFYYEVVLGIQPAVSWADPAFLTCYPLLLWGVLSFPMAHRDGKTRLTFGLDAGTVMLGAVMVIWHFLLRPIAMAESSGLLESLVTLAFPVGATVSLFGIVVVVLRKPEEGVRRALAVLTLGIIGVAVGDLGYAHQALQGVYQGGNWPDKFYMGGFFLMALSGQYQYWRASRRSGEAEQSAQPEPVLTRDGKFTFSWLPYLGIALGYGVLLVVCFKDMVENGDGPLDELIIGAVIITGFVVARQVAAVRENVRLLRERAARQSEERFRSLVQHSSDIITVLEADLTIIYESPSVEAVLGYEAKGLVGRGIFTLLHHDDRQKAEAFFAAVMREPGATALGEHRLRHRDGTLLNIESVGTNLLHDPNVRGIVLNSRNVTERKRVEEALRVSEEQLRQSQKLESIGTMAGGIAHDFNNLLTVISGNTQLVLAKLDPDSQPHQRLVEVEAATDRATTLTRQMLAFSRRQQLERKTINLNDTIGEILKLLRRTIGADVDLCFQAAGNLSTVFADPAQIEQVVMNLVINACDAMPQGGRLTIDTDNATLDERFIQNHPLAAPGRYAHIVVSDTGTGMDDVTLARIFEPFFTTKEVGRGTGLGLSMVFGIVKQHNGLIEVSSWLGKGTTFNIYLPVDDKAVAEVERIVQPALRGGTETILVVEDEESLRKLTQMCLEDLGYRVLLARDGVEAMELYRANSGKINMVIMDVVMPRMGGQEAYEQIRSSGSDVPVIFMTGYSSEMAQSQFIEKSGAPLLRKPYKVEALGRKVRETLDTMRVREVIYA